MANPASYREQVKIENTVKLREFLQELPPYVKEYFRAKETTTSDKTRLSYAYDLRVFFRFLKETNPALSDKPLSEISLSDLSMLKPVDFEEFEEYLKAYRTPDQRIETNSRIGIARKMSCLRSFYDYLCKRELLTTNPVRLVDMPKIKEKAIIQLDTDEVAALLDYMENYGNDLTGVKLFHYQKQKYRDIAIVTLLLGTGVRVSELVGLNIQDVDFKNNGIRIIRKGGNEMIVKNAELETVCGITSKLPENGQIEVAFAGKSNVGKSSLINGLMNRKSLARTSSAPGKTQTINFYAVTGRRETKKEAQGMVSADEKVYLVDLPGYGYAKVSQNEKQKWGKMIEDYLHKSSQLKAVFLLIDIRHDPSANDKQMYDWVLHNGFSPIIIATKLDKIKRSQVQKQVKAIKQGLQVEKGTLVIPFSAETKQGREEIWSVIEGFLDAE